MKTEESENWHEYMVEEKKIEVNEVRSTFKERSALLALDMNRNNTYCTNSQVNTISS